MFECTWKQEQTMKDKNNRENGWQGATGLHNPKTTKTTTIEHSLGSSILVVQSFSPEKFSTSL